MFENIGKYVERNLLYGTFHKIDVNEFLSENQEEINSIQQRLNSREGQKGLDFEVSELSGGFKTNFSTTETFAQAQQGEIGGFTWNKRHLQFCDTFFVLMEMDDMEKWWPSEDNPRSALNCELDDVADYIFLCDEQNFHFEQIREKELLIENRSRKVTIQVKKKKMLPEILKCLYALKANFQRLNNSTAQNKLYDHESFAPIRPKTECKWLLCGKDYMEDVADAMENAKERIMIADWQISPCVYLKRPWCSDVQAHVVDDYWRLDKIMQRKAEQGVRIYILVYQDPKGLGLNNYDVTKFFRRFTRKKDKDHGNIFTLTHPENDGPFLWAHHEKMVCIDEKIAFVGGIDLARGRWELHGAYPIFDKLGKTFVGNDYWNQFNTKPADNYVSVIENHGSEITAAGWRDDRLDRTTETRSPWHDVSTSIKGAAAHDVGRHFIERWNSCIYQCFRAAVKINTPGLRRFRIPAGASQMFKQVMVPRLFSEVHKEVQPAQHQPNHHQTSTFPGSMPMAGMDFQGHFNHPPPLQQPDYSVLYPGLHTTTTTPYPQNPASYLPNPNYINPQTPAPYQNPVPMAQNFAQMSMQDSNMWSGDCQVLRSSTTWSAGVGKTEKSIINAYETLIRDSKKYVYIENQFFVTASSTNGRVQNQIGQFLAKRIVQAYTQNEDFRIYVVIPCVPGMNGRLEENTAAGQEVILHLTYESILRNDNSIRAYCRDNGVPGHDWLKHIYFASFRTSGINPENGDIVQEIVYPHSKLIIVDDEYTLMGSANINDRSMLGERDSEVAVIIRDKEYAKSLRLRIWSVALGASEAQIEHECPSTARFFEEIWKKCAIDNFSIYEDVFCVLPNNTVWSMPDVGGTLETVSEDYKTWKLKYDNRPAVTDPQQAKEKIQNIRGTLVVHPLEFLKEETKISTFSDLLKNPSMALSKEGMAQWFAGHLFE